MSARGSTLEETFHACTKVFETLYKTTVRSGSKADDLRAEFSSQYDRLKLWAHDVNITDNTLKRKLASSSLLHDFTLKLLGDY